MALPPFSQNFTKLDEQAYRKGLKPDAGTTGPYAPAKTYPNTKDFLAGFAEKVFGPNNPTAKKFYDSSFSADSAEQQQQKIDSLTDTYPRFTDNKGDVQLIDDWRKKYELGVMQKEIIPPGEAVLQSSIANIQSEQPGQGVNNPNVRVAGKMNYPGATGIQTS